MIIEKTLKIRQTFALFLLCFYFLIQVLDCFGIHIIKYKNYYDSQKFFYIIDAGHGYYGNKCSGKAVLDENGYCFYEWIYNWNIRTHLTQMLDKQGIEYVLVNTNKYNDMQLDDRVVKINNIKSKKPKILISIHGNAASDFPDANGFEVYSPKGTFSTKYFYKDKKEFSDTLANLMYGFISKEFPEHLMRYENSNQNYKEANFTILAKTKCYAILTENEFFTTPKMRELMRTEEFKIRVAKAHFNFINHMENR